MGEKVAVMSCVRFRFKSSMEYDKVTFEGLQISVAELREKIMTQKKLGLSSDFTLEIIDPLNGKGLSLPPLFSLSLSHTHTHISLSYLSLLSSSLLSAFDLPILCLQFTRMTVK